MIEFRRLGRSGIKVSPLGLGTARMADLGWREDLVPLDSSQAKRDAVRQIQAAVDLGVTFFDTVDNYGQGLSKRILGEALRGRQDDIVVATKFGEDPMPDLEDPWSLDAGSVEQACEASLRRLGVECIDLYLLHRRNYPLERAPPLMKVLEDLVRAGKICYYGWSTDDVERARLFARGEHCIAIEHRLNVFNDNAAMLDLCQEQDLASLNRVPLLMGVLTGRWSPETKLEEGDPQAQWFEQEGFLKVLGCAQQIELPARSCCMRNELVAHLIELGTPYHSGMVEAIHSWKIESLGGDLHLVATESNYGDWSDLLKQPNPGSNGPGFCRGGTRRDFRRFDLRKSTIEAAPPQIPVYIPHPACGR